MFLSRTLLKNKKVFILGSTAILSSAYLITRTPTSINPFTIGSSSSKQMSSSSESFPKGKTEQEWQAQLSPEQFRILRKKGTEAAGTGELDGHYSTSGTYDCAGCGTPLYKAGTKFKSGCGWPAFFQAIPGAVVQYTDSSWGMARTEICCRACNGHLGHLFMNEGYDNPTKERACVNSVSIKFSPEDNVPETKAKA